VVLCEANERVLVKLRNAGVLQAGPDDDYHATFQSALSGLGLDQAPARAASEGLDSIARRFIDASRAYLSSETDRST